jgi:carbon storage regulator
MGYLVLSRRINETVVIGSDIKLTVLGIQGGQVKIGIAAPKDVRVDREEVRNRINHEKLMEKTA